MLFSLAITTLSHYTATHAEGSLCVSLCGVTHSFEQHHISCISSFVLRRALLTNEEAGGNQSNAGNGGQTTDSPKDNVSNPQPASVAYSPQNVVSLATAKCQAGGMITTQQNLQNHLNDGSITQEEYNEYYPYDGMEGSYYSVFVETDLNKASTIDGQRLSSEDAIAEYIASMLLLETDPVFYISYDGVYTTGGTDYYEFRCHR